MLQSFKKSILANGENVFEMNSCHSFSEPHTTEEIQMNIEGRDQLFLIETVRLNCGQRN